MLTKCPECQLQVSDKAIVCPHCGYPIAPQQQTKVIRSSNKRKRLPNGFGQISEIKGRNIRNRFRAMVPVGKREDGRTIVKMLKPKAYFNTYNDAYAALMEYNKNPYDLDNSITVQQLYERWTKEYFETLNSDSSKRTITAAWAYCSSIYNIPASELRARHIKGCMDNGVANIKGVSTTPTAGIKSRIKSMFNLMLDYALEYEIVDKNYARTFSVSDEIVNEINESTRGHITFTDEEMNTLWENINVIPYVDVILIQCYSGWRPQELGLIKVENVNLSDGTMIGGMKTKAGTDRIVPIHPRIKPLIEAKYKEAIELGSEYLINCTDGTTHRSSIAFTYDKYQKRFCKIRDELKLNPLHRAHDGRMHFVTMAKKYNVDEYAIKYIVGHQIQDITEKVYTERKLEWLQQEMKKIK